MSLLSITRNNAFLRQPVRSKLFRGDAIRLLATDNIVQRHKVKKILEADSTIVGQKIKIQGWVRTIRDQKKFSFIEINDGSSLKGLQAVVLDDCPSYDEVKNLSTGAAAEIIGTIIESQGKGQKYELQASEVKLVGACPADSYPLQKKRHTQEYLRTIAHIRARTNTISAVARVRSALAYATHQYFQNEGFIYVQTPLITSSDCEGAGEMFRVTTLPLDNINNIPILKDNIKDNIKDIKEHENKTENTETDKGTDNILIDKKKTPISADFSKDFFGKPTYLTVSGQLSGETYACALGDIYTFGPTFRAELSQTSRHLAEFHMIEPELAFSNMYDAMNNAENYIKYIIKYILSNCTSDIDFFEQYIDKNIKLRLKNVIDKPFIRISYKDAIILLQKEINKDKTKWNYPNIIFGSDLQTEHERWLAEKYYNSCVFIHNYPREIKAFYMRDNEEDNNKTVDSFDLIVPGVGELIGGSQREERLDILRSKMKEFHLNENDYEWYLDLRRYGTVPHSGYGLGFERLVCYVTGIENIRDAIAYPRYLGNADF